MNTSSSSLAGVFTRDILKPIGITPVRDSGAQPALIGEKEEDESQSSCTGIILESNSFCYRLPIDGGNLVSQKGPINLDEFPNISKDKGFSKDLFYSSFKQSNNNGFPTVLKQSTLLIEDDSKNCLRNVSAKRDFQDEELDKYKNKGSRDKTNTMEQFSPSQDNNQTKFNYDNSSLRPISEITQSYDLASNLQKQTKQPNEEYQDNQATPLIWRKKFFKLLLLSNRFLFQVKKQLQFFRPLELTESQFCAIGDKGALSYHEAQRLMHFNQPDIYKPKKRSPLQRRIQITYLQFKKRIKCIVQPIGAVASSIKRKAKSLDKSIPLANPFGIVMLFWDLVLMFISFYNLLIIPYEICFSMDLYEQKHSWLNKISVLVYFLDVLISMNTGNYIKGELEKNRAKVIKIYLQDHCLNDITCLCCLIFVNPFGIEFLRLLFLLKIAKLAKLLEKNREYFQIDDKYSSSMNLIVLLVKIMYLCHLFACFWYKLGRFVQSQGDLSWLDSFDRGGDQDYSNEDLYINAIYYSAVTITTVGYGDITPKSKLERLFVFFMAFISCANFGYALNKIGSIMLEMNTRKESYRHNVAILNKYMKQCEVSKILQSKARRYLEYVESQSNNFSNPQEIVFSLLSSQLQNKIKKEVSLKTLRRIPFLFQEFSEQCLSKIAMIVEEKCFNIGETLVDSGETYKSGLFYIIRGEASVYTNHLIQSKPFAKFSNGSIFGQTSFFMQNNQNKVSIISTSPMMVHLIPLDDFLAVLEDFPKEREIYSFYKDSALLNKDFSKMHHACLSCKSNSHEIGQCPYIAYHPKPQRVIGNYLKERGDFRSSFKRKYRKFSPFESFNQTQKGAFQLQIELLEELGSQGSEKESHPSLENVEKDPVDRIDANEQRDSLTVTSQVFFPNCNNNTNNPQKKSRLSQENNNNNADTLKSIENNNHSNFQNSKHSFQNNLNSNTQTFLPLKLLEYNNSLMSPSSNTHRKTGSRHSHSQFSISLQNQEQNQKKSNIDHFSQQAMNSITQSTGQIPNLNSQQNPQNAANVFLTQDQRSPGSNIQDLLILILNQIQIQGKQHQQLQKCQDSNKNLDVTNAYKVQKRSFQQAKTVQPFNELSPSIFTDRYQQCWEHRCWEEGNGEIGVSLQSEVMKQFEIYFPQNNVGVVVNKVFQKSLNLEQFVKIYGKLNKHKHRKLHNRKENSPKK